MMKRRQIVKGRRGNNRGFTLIEIIAVLVILAIISAVVISRGTGTDAAKLQAEVDTLKGHLRYAQYLAMNDTPPTKYGINVGTGSYALVRNPASTTSNYYLPGESSATHSFSPITATAYTVSFDEWGSPTITGSPNIGGQSITITPNTGFIQ
jgi:prepilin-type N-terminal cleavage/methylation domain-containing protein